MATRSKRGAGKSENGTSSGPSRDLGPSKGIEIKTKFPVARIKRIMQADEEVGKVAQVTPVAVCKSSYRILSYNHTNMHYSQSSRTLHGRPRHTLRRDR
jgi:hypothetical protein